MHFFDNSRVEGNKVVSLNWYCNEVKRKILKIVGAAPEREKF